MVTGWPQQLNTRCLQMGRARRHLARKNACMGGTRLAQVPGRRARPTWLDLIPWLLSARRLAVLCVVLRRAASHQACVLVGCCAPQWPVALERSCRQTRSPQLTSVWCEEPATAVSRVAQLTCF